MAANFKIDPSTAQLRSSNGGISIIFEHRHFSLTRDQEQSVRRVVIGATVEADSDVSKLTILLRQFESCIP
jgi:hypothetical protein